MPFFFFSFLDLLQQALGTTSDRMESALKYLLTFSSRPPQTFVAHQKLLWMLDALMSVDAGW